MKVIDLLNKIANGEEVPKIIKVDNKVYYYDETDYAEFYRYKDILEELLTDYANLNDEVEVVEEEQEEQEDNFTGFKMYSDGKCFCSIDTSERIKCRDDIETKEDKKIERIKDLYFTQEKINENLMRLADKINEIIDKINKE